MFTEILLQICFSKNLVATVFWFRLGLGFLFLKVFLFFWENQMSKTRNSHGIKAGKIVEKLKQYLKKNIQNFWIAILKGMKSLDNVCWNVHLFDPLHNQWMRQEAVHILLRDPSFLIPWDRHSKNNFLWQHCNALFRNGTMIKQYFHSALWEG